MGRSPQLTAERLQTFWNKIVKTETCWYWQGCVSGANRGSFMLDGKRYVPTEVMLMLHGQFREGGLMILHTCDHGACVNPDHLYWGTQFDNMRDRNERHPGWKWGERKTLTKKEKLRAAVRPSM